MDRFWAECGARYPRGVGLNQRFFNSGYGSTHFVINTFANAGINKPLQVLRNCPDGLRFLEELQAAGVQQVTQYIGLAPIDANDWGRDTVFAKFDIVVDPEDQAAYAQAYAKMMAEVGEDIELHSYGLGAVASRQIYPLDLDQRPNRSGLGALSENFGAPCLYRVQQRSGQSPGGRQCLPKFRRSKSIPSTKALGTREGRASC